jgi:hypothetical protein
MEGSIRATTRETNSVENLARKRANRLHNAGGLFVCETWIDGQGDGPSVHFFCSTIFPSATRKVRMQGTPDGSLGFDASTCKIADKTIRILRPDHVSEKYMIPIPWRKLNSTPVQFPIVVFGDLAPALNELRKLLQLNFAHRGRQPTEPIVIADLVILPVIILEKVFHVTPCDKSTMTGGHYLCGIEGPYGRSPRFPGPDRHCKIFDHSRATKRSRMTKHMGHNRDTIRNILDIPIGTNIEK